MKKIAIIVAGGSGQRMGTSTPKQFLLLKNKPLLSYTIEAFLNAYNDLTIILVLPKEHRQYGEELINIFSQKDRITIVTGGITRFESVQNGLQQVKEESIVFVHDGVRCLVEPALIRACYEQAIAKGSAIPAVAATDSIRIVTGEGHVVTDRNNVRIIQTPQTFKSTILLPAFMQPYQDAFTDEATVVEASGIPVFLIEGSYNNIKVTRPIDLLTAEKILEEKSE